MDGGNSVAEEIHLAMVSNGGPQDLCEMIESNQILGNFEHTREYSTTELSCGFIYSFVNNEGEITKLEPDLQIVGIKRHEQGDGYIYRITLSDGIAKYSHFILHEHLEQLLLVYFLC